MLVAFVILLMLPHVELRATSAGAEARAETRGRQRGDAADATGSQGDRARRGRPSGRRTTDSDGARRTGADAW